MNNRKPIFGVGINDADYVVRKTQRVIIEGKTTSRTLWFCPYYKRWADMLKRCYSVKNLAANQTYEGCTVCDEWLIFSNFKAWMELQDWEGKYLDKDFLGSGKLYSEESCIFIDNDINTFISPFSRTKKGIYPIGVSFDKRRDKFKAEIKEKGETLFLGYFISSCEAHHAWQKEKVRIANVYKERESDVRLKAALQKLIDRIEDDLHQGKETK